MKNSNLGTINAFYLPDNKTLIKVENGGIY